MAAPVAATLGTVLASGTRTNSVVPAPASVVSGDVVEVILYLETATAPGIPSGFAEITFTPVPTTTGNISYQRRYWKRSTGSEPASYTFTHASTWTAGRAIRITGCVATGTPFELYATTGSAARSSSGTVTPAVSGTTGGPDRLLSCGYTDFAGGTWTAPSGFSGGGSHNELGFSYKAQAVAGATGSLTATSSTAGVQTITLVGYLPVAAASTATDIRVGGSTPSAIYVGSSLVSAVYVGSTKVWG